MLLARDPGVEAPTNLIVYEEARLELASHGGTNQPVVDEFQFAREHDRNAPRPTGGMAVVPANPWSGPAGFSVTLVRR